MELVIETYLSLSVGRAPQEGAESSRDARMRHLCACLAIQVACQALLRARAIARGCVCVCMCVCLSVCLS